MNSELISFKQALLSIDRVKARTILMDRLAGLSPVERVESIIVPALDEIGELWSKGEAALSQVYMAGRICEELVDEILPPEAPERKGQPNMAVAVLDDYHLLGKRIVYSVLRASGFKLLDYGRVDAPELVEKALADGVELLLISTLMLPSALLVKDVRERLDKAGSTMKLVVGGAPFRFDPSLWKEVGADAMGWSASESLEIIDRLTGGDQE
jgi:methanogenic corrinoid protein MtbC1